MEATAKSRISIKLFFGFEATALFRQHIYNNTEWEQALITWQAEPQGIQKILHEGNEYIGIFLENHQVSLEFLKEEKKRVSCVVEKVCPELNTESLKFQVFPQIFIS